MTVFSRRQARRAVPEGRVPSRGRSALARLTTRVVPVAAVGGLAGLSLVVPAVTAAAPAVAAASARSPRSAIRSSARRSPAPISTSQCQAQLGIACYSPLQYRMAYDLNPL